MSPIVTHVGQPFYVRVREYQRSIIRGALRRHHGNQVKAAADLGLHRNTLARYLNLLGIDPSAFYRKSDHERHQAQQAWRAAKIAEGLCANCVKRTAGGPGGSETCCRICAQKKRDRENKRYRQQCIAIHLQSASVNEVAHA
jgi:hypothetical protein